MNIAKSSLIAFIATPFMMGFSLGEAVEKLPYKPKEFVDGGQFKDLIQAIPIINGLERDGIWGGENVLPRDKDNGIEDNQWSYWGGNPMLDKDGKYHIAVCRWLESTGHNGWFHSEVALCTSESGNPLGPYKIVRTILEKSHNPEVMKMPDGSFALHEISSRVYTAESMTGEWKLLGKMMMEPRGFRESSNFGSNLTSAIRPDGSILIMTKGGDITISHTGLLGPYKMASIDTYARNSGYAEDPVVWRSRHQYHCIYNHAQDRVSAYMRSLDGIHWKNEEGLPYDVSSTYYTDGTKNEWHKFERAKVVLDQHGRASYLSLAVMDVSKGEDKGNDKHSSKNMIMPLTVERFARILNQKTITPETKRISVKLEAEEGFSPLDDMDMATLRFGSDSKVNHGEGCKVVEWEKDGDDIILHFEGENGINRFDYDFKLIGKEKSGELILAYTLLPDRAIEAPSLIAQPVKLSAEGVKCIIENIGLSKSPETPAKIVEYRAEGRRIVKELLIPALNPYQSTSILAEQNITEGEEEDREYAVEIGDNEKYQGYWRMVDDKDKAVVYSGSWTENTGKQYFLNGEHTTTKGGSSAKFTFTGTKARVYGTLDNSYGSFDVFIDGVFVESIRLSWGGAMRKIYQTPSLEEGKHSLELKCATYRGNTKGSIDAFSYESINNK